MGKRSYRAEKVKGVDWERVQSQVEGAQRIVVGIDVAKEEMVASVETEAGVVGRFKWQHPQETASAVSRLCGLGAVEVAMEPSGTYGDPVRYQFERSGALVFRVSPKRVHDAAEVFDGTPSLHDAKSCGLIAKLHWEGCSERWSERKQSEREARATMQLVGMYEQQEHRLLNQLEAQLARYWPESLMQMDLASLSFVALLAELGSPAAVSQEPARAVEILRQASRGKLREEKREELVVSARATIGQPMSPAERHLIEELAREVKRLRAATAKASRRWSAELTSSAAVSRLEGVVGKKAALALVALLGEPQRYVSAHAYRKAMGLGLKEKSSGKHRGQLRITKRGPGLVRWYLYLAVLRLIKRPGVLKAWYLAKVARDGGRHRSKAVVAVMRKLVLALWHVARGEAFEAERLFDARRLGLALR